MKIYHIALLLLTACTASVDTGGADPPAPDPCNRQGSGWEDVPGCLCALECPDKAPDCDAQGHVVARYARVCDEGACSYRATCGPDTPRPAGAPYPACLTPVDGSACD